MAFKTRAARSSGRTGAKAPPNAPIGVRIASIITGVDMKNLLKFQNINMNGLYDFTISEKP
jgi:hypothetical protein